MHTLIFADEALGAKNARDCSQKQYFDAGMERTNRDRNGQKSEKSKSSDKKCSYRGRLDVKKNDFVDSNRLKSFCKNGSPARAGTTFLKKYDAKSELKHEKHKRSSLKLAFLMHVRIMIRPK